MNCGADELGDHSSEPPVFFLVTEKMATEMMEAWNLATHKPLAYIEYRGSVPPQIIRRIPLWSAPGQETA